MDEGTKELLDLMKEDDERLSSRSYGDVCLTEYDTIKSSLNSVMDAYLAQAIIKDYDTDEEFTTIQQLEALSFYLLEEAGALMGRVMIERKKANGTTEV